MSLLLTRSLTVWKYTSIHSILPHTLLIIFIPVASVSVSVCLVLSFLRWVIRIWYYSSALSRTTTRYILSLHRLLPMMTWVRIPMCRNTTIWVILISNRQQKRPCHSVARCIYSFIPCCTYGVTGIFLSPPSSVVLGIWKLLLDLMTNFG